MDWAGAGQGLEGSRQGVLGQGQGLGFATAMSALALQVRGSWGRGLGSYGQRMSDISSYPLSVANFHIRR